MTAIAASADGTVALGFQTPSGTVPVVADQVILTTPFSGPAHARLHEAGFDARKQTAITQLGAGRNAKLQLQFASRYWNSSGPWGISNGDSYTDLGYQNTWDVTRAQARRDGHPGQLHARQRRRRLPSSTPYSNAGRTRR